MKIFLKTTAILSFLLASPAFAGDKSWDHRNTDYYQNLLGLPANQPLVKELSPPPKLPANAVSKCSPDADKMMDYLTGLNYKVLFYAPDQSRPELKREILFNKDDGALLEVTIVRDHLPKDEEDFKTVKNIKLCLEWSAEGSFGDGPTFKDYVLRQHMDLVDAYISATEAEKKREREKQHEPDQGNGNAP